MARAVETVSACIRAFSGIGAGLSLCRIDDFVEAKTLPKQVYQESLDYSSLYRRYELENQFLRTIETGDAENVLTAFDRMQTVNIGANRYVNVSESHPFRTFKKETGMTVTQYIARLRCQNAAELLRNGDDSIQEIAAFVGYLDGNYFVKVFKKWFGVTPSEYRAGDGAK